MTRFLFTVSLIALLCAPASQVAAQPQAVGGEVYFDLAERQLYVPWYEGVPTVYELQSPHRLVVEVPWTSRMAEGAHAYRDDWIRSVQVRRRGLVARIELGLTRPLNGRWYPSASRGLFSLSILNPQRLAADKFPPAGLKASTAPRPTPSPKPVAMASTDPRPTPSPKPVAKTSTAPRPTPSPKPVAMASTDPRPTPSPKPVAKKSTAPRPTPSPRPVAKTSTAPRPTPSPKPVAKASAGLQPTSTLKAAVSAEMSKPPRVGRFSYDDEVRYFLLPVNRKVVPVFNELANPPRLLIDLPGTEVSQVQKRVYAGALVREAILESGPTGGARATLFLARPITNHWKWKHSGNNLVVVFDHRPVIQPSPVAPSATPKPTVTSIPKPASSPSPVASKPGEAQKASVPSPAVRAGHLFAGTVFNINSGEPVPGVRVIAGNEQAVSDRDGRFELRGLSQGAHTVSVSASGFSAQTFSILVPDDKSISLNLVPSL